MFSKWILHEINTYWMHYGILGSIICTWKLSSLDLVSHMMCNRYTPGQSAEDCEVDQYYDDNRQMCLDICDGVRCGLDFYCSRRDGLTTLFCTNFCYQSCNEEDYCDYDTAECLPCQQLCSGEEDVKCRALCHGENLYTVLGGIENKSSLHKFYFFQLSRLINGTLLRK